MGKIIMFPKNIAGNKNNSEKTLLDYLNTLNKFVPIFIAGFAMLSGFNTTMKFYYYGISFTFFDYDVKNTFVIYIKHISTWLGILLLPDIIAQIYKNTKLWIKASFQIFSTMLCVLIVMIFHTFLYIDIVVYYKVPISIIFVIPIIICGGIVFCYLHGYLLANDKILLNNLKERKEKYKIKHALYKIFNIFFFIAFVVLFLISIIDLSGVSYKFKKSYEFVNLNEEELVVLFQGNNKTYLANFCLELKDGDCKKAVLKIYTNKYLILETTDFRYTNKEFYDVIIQKDEIFKNTCCHLIY